MHKCCSKQFLDFIDLKYPQLSAEPSYRRFFFYLCFSNWSDPTSHCVLIPHKLIAKCCDQPGHRFRSDNFLKNFQRDVLPDFQWNEAIPSTGWESGKCRSVKDLGLDNQTRRMISLELEEIGKEDYEREKYYFDTKLKYHKDSQQRDYKECLEEYKDLYNIFNQFLNPTQKKIMLVAGKSGLSQSFIKKLYYNKDLVEKTIQNIKLNIDDTMTLEDKKQRQYKIRESILENPRVFYKPTSFLHTARLHHHGECVLSFCREVRKALCQGWTDVDLVSSQFIIIANLFKADLAIQIIKDKINLWKYCHHHSGLSGEMTSDQKRVYKKFIYSICYGMGEASLVAGLRLIKAQGLIKNPMIAQLLKKRREWFNQIDRDGKISDIWGVEHSIMTAGKYMNIFGKTEKIQDRWAGSLAATFVQSVEMEIISGIYDLVLNYPKTRCQIMLHQHDGVCVSFFDKEKKDSIQQQMQQAITHKSLQVGEKLGIDLSDMKLEFEDL